MNSWNKCKVGNTTATLLLAEVKAHGVPTLDTEELNNLADVVGHMTQIQLHEAFEMNPDQTLFILKSVWNIMEVINFYNNEREYQPKHMTLAAIDNVKTSYDNKIDALIREHNDLLQVKDHVIAQAESQIQEYTNQVNYQAETITKLQDEVIKLKAQLWDMSQAK